MNYIEACKCLELDHNVNLTEYVIKKQYRALALKYHPDKTLSNDNINFHQIKNAHDYLLEYEGYYDNDNDIFNDNSNVSFNNSYNNVLYNFINLIVSDDCSNTIIKHILTKINCMCKQKALQTLENIDKQILIKIYNLLLKYHDYFHYDSNFLNDIKQIIVNKSNDDERIILNPSLQDLFDKNLYKLSYNDEYYYVPLWHNEVIFDISDNKQLYVSCLPILPDNITIDNYNNIHVYVKYCITDIWNTNTINVDIGSRNIIINVNELKITDNQIIKYNNIGIPLCNTNDIYNVSKSSHIIVHIHLHNLSV